MAALTASDPQRNQSSSAPKSGPASCRASLRACVFVGFSDNRRLAIVVRFGVVVLVLVIVGVSRRHADDRDKAPTVLGGRRGIKRTCVTPV